MVRSFDQVSIVLPEHFQLFPSIPHAVERNVGGVAEIIILELVPVPTHFCGISRAPRDLENGKVLTRSIERAIKGDCVVSGSGKSR
jgi:hypothetical protein